jgi:hypothetical protein
MVFLLTSTPVLSQDSKYDDLLIGSKLYKPYTGYFKVGIGWGYHRLLDQTEYNIDLSYTIRIGKLHIRPGYHLSADEFVTKRTYQKLNDLYFLGGWRSENKKWNLSAMAGPTFAYGATLAYRTDDEGKLSDWYRGFSTIGLYGSVEITRKLFYDLGLGLSLYGSLNKEYDIVGLQIHFYFSNAYKGTIQ